MSAMHGGWPLTQCMPYAPGRISAQNLAPISHGAEQIHKQALLIEADAVDKEARAIELRTAATGGRIGQKEKLKIFMEANELEEEAEKYRRESDRLRAEALHLDGELARDLEENGGAQARGIIHQAL